MATIGSFIKHENGFTGAVKTLSLNVKAKFIPAENKKNDKAPDFRILTDNIEFAPPGRKPRRTDEPISVCVLMTPHSLLRSSQISLMAKTPTIIR